MPFATRRLFSRGQLIGLDRDVHRRVHHVGILVRLDEGDLDVGALLANLAGRGDRARDRLADDDHLDVRVVRQADELGDDRLLLVHEVVGVGHVLHVVRAVLLDDHLPGAELVLSLRDGPGHDSDLEVDGALRRRRIGARRGGRRLGRVLLAAAGEGEENHGKRGQDCGRAEPERILHWIAASTRDAGIRVPAERSRWAGPQSLGIDTTRRAAR